MEIEKKEVEKKAATTKDVPETILKRRKRIAQVKAVQDKRNAERKVRDRKKRKVIFKNAESYVKEYRKMETELIKQRRISKTKGTFFVEPEAKLLFVIRIKGINGVPPKPKKILQLLRLGQVNNGVFVRVNKATMNMVKLVQNYVTFGYPNLKSVRELIYKRGFGSVGGQRIPLTDNRIVEQALGRFHVICMEDLIHEIFTVGDNFKQANAFMWPFKLNSPKGGFKSIVRPFTDGGDAGNREDMINDLIRRMN